MSDALLRLFFAIWPDEQERTATDKQVREHLSPTLQAGRPVPAANLHVTLLFLGEVRPEALPALYQAAADVARISNEFVFQLQALTYWRKPRVLVLTSDELPVGFESLTTTLRMATRAIVPLQDATPARLHVTIARKVTPQAGAESQSVLRAALQWRARAIALVQSVTRESGSRYTVLQHWPLRDAVKTGKSATE